MKLKRKLKVLKFEFLNRNIYKVAEESVLKDLFLHKSSFLETLNFNISKDSSD